LAVLLSKEQGPPLNALTDRLLYSLLIILVAKEQMVELCDIHPPGLHDLVGFPLQKECKVNAAQVKGLVQKFSQNPPRFSGPVLLSWTNTERLWGITRPTAPTWL